MNKNDLIYSTVKIKAGLNDGTGFIIDFSLRKDVVVLALITNKHVVESSNDIEIVLTIQKDNGEFITESQKISNYKRGYFEHDRYDLCVISLDPVVEKLIEKNEKIVAPHLTINDICSENELMNSNAIEDVFVVGYPDGFIDDANNLPMAKRGVTATPLYSDFKKMKTFVVDAGVMEGNSGSPVYIKKDSGVFKLVGVIYASNNSIVEAGFIQDNKRINGYFVMPTGLGVAIKAFEIFELWKKVKFNYEEKE